MSEERANKPSGQHRTPKSRGQGARVRVVVLIAALVVAVVLLGSLVRVLGGMSATAEQKPTPTPPATSPTVTPEPTATPVPTPRLPDVDVGAWNLRLVRYENPLGESFVPESLADVGDNERMDSRVADSLKALVAAAKADGYTVYLCSGYRDYDTQYYIYWNHINTYMAQGMTEEEAHAATRLAVNYPGCSEHQSGLAMDVLESPSQDMEPYIGGSGLMLWLEQHCADYGFVIRYPEDKTSVTGVEYEPWHLRYVGGIAAKYIMEHGLCLEEFLELYDDAVEAVG